MAKRNRPRTRAESRARYYIREEARRRGWNVAHLSSGGEFLEENEIVASFPTIGLGLEKPDFLVCLRGEPVAVVEAKNEAGKIETAIQEAMDYADLINGTGQFRVPIAVGAAGEEDAGFVVEVRFLSPTGWVPLQSKGAEITTFPSHREVELAIEAGSGSTDVSVPESSDFIDAAINLSSILRACRIEAFLRPRVIGALVLAMYQGTIDAHPEHSLASVNALTEAAVRQSLDMSQGKQERLIDALRLSGADFDRLAGSIGRIVSILRGLNVRSVLQTDTDFLGLFYEAFLRYGYDNNALGIVFTPRHITRFCVELAGVGPQDRVIDIASGTGGFLVAAFDTMLQQAHQQGSPALVDKIKRSIAGYDTNPTVWALAMLNMFFRGDGKSNIEHGSSLEAANKASIFGNYTRAFLNPPFSQEGEPERDFIDVSMSALEPGGILTTVVAAGIFADEEHAAWRREFTRKHTVMGVISLPEDLFYPTAAPTSILIAKALFPQPEKGSVFMGRIWQDGFEKLKGRRIERGPNQLPQIKEAFTSWQQNAPFVLPAATTVVSPNIRNGAEWSPQQWLPQPELSQQQIEGFEQNCLYSVLQSVAQFPDLAEAALDDFGCSWQNKPALPCARRGGVVEFFEVRNGNSSGEKNYSDGSCPYISSGDTTNSIVRLVQAQEEECFNGAITVTAFGQACVQPWTFMARGNGGSAVRVLTPRFNMSVRELVWFAAQINAQRWRFFYARMAIKSRLERLVVHSPTQRLPDDTSIAANVRAFRDSLLAYSRLTL